MATHKTLQNIKKIYAANARKIYNIWQQHEGHSDIVDNGGICDLIADTTIEELNQIGFDATIFHHNDHAHVLVELTNHTTKHPEKIIFNLPWQIYEEKTGKYHYQKIENVHIKPEDIIAKKIRHEQKINKPNPG